MPPLSDPEVLLSLSYVPQGRRAALESVWALDAQLGSIVRSTTEPLIGAMRLTWWRDAVEALEDGPAPAEPLLQRIQAELAGSPVDMRRLAEMAEGWIALLDPFPLPAETLADYARQRGGALFGEAARLLGAADQPAAVVAGEGWALVDFALRCSDPITAESAIGLAVPRLEEALARRWPRALRPLGMLAHLALRDARAGLWAKRRQGSPRRLLRALRHQLTGT